MRGSALTALFLAYARAVLAQQYGGVNFEIRFEDNQQPSQTWDIKQYYEQAAAKIAYESLHKAVQSSDLHTDCFPTQEGSEPQSIYDVKKCIDQNSSSEYVYVNLFNDDISYANNFWETVVAQSDTNMENWVPARVYAKAYFNGRLDANTFAAWNASPPAEIANNGVNPEHYVQQNAWNADKTQSAHVLEGWGGVLSSFGTIRTEFNVPSFAPPDWTKYPSKWQIPDPAFAGGPQVMGEKQLERDDKTFGVLHFAVRDFDDGNYGTGIEVYSAVWYPPWDKAANPDDHGEFITKFVQDASYHMVVEVINLTLRARDDTWPSSCRYTNVL